MIFDDRKHLKLKSIEIRQWNNLKTVDLTKETESILFDHRRLRSVGDHLIIMRSDRSHGLVCVTKFNSIKGRVRNDKSAHFQSLF